MEALEKEMAEDLTKALEKLIKNPNFLDNLEGNDPYTALNADDDKLLSKDL